ncbi:hypothetical protein D7V90_17755 [bacterium 1xD42-87]|nr:hypothetical protein D7V90_17755 [bacterium 1xD42-87]
MFLSCQSTGRRKHDTEKACMETMENSEVWTQRKGTEKYSPNLPVRFLIYLAQEYQAVIEQAEEKLLQYWK